MNHPIPCELQDPTALKRFESLGDNCEFGFVLQSVLQEDGSIFRWASMATDQLYMLLTNDFEQMYEYENLFPCTPGMVRDKKYGIAWHTDMKSHVVNGELVFVANETDRRVIYNNEKDKRMHLLRKFISRLQGGSVIYVIKSRSKPASHVFDGIYQELKRLAQGADFWMVEVVEAKNQEMHAKVEIASQRRLRAYISKYSAYDQADAAQYEEWYKIMARVLELDRRDQEKDASSQLSDARIAG